MRLVDMAKVIRSKNAGVDKITFDIIFRNEDYYHKACQSSALTADAIAKLFNISVERISDFAQFDPANAIKFTIYRRVPSGSPGDPDIFGSQQYAPLLDVEIDDAEGQKGGGSGQEHRSRQEAAR
ncbi:MAG: DUF4387 domain-containing protein [Firmicutes bacterium]|nr:DUF4387 domain-containing protein [Bacillota bacterium]